MRPSAEAVGANRWHRRHSSAMLVVPIWHRRRVKEWEFHSGEWRQSLDIPYVVKTLGSHFVIRTCPERPLLGSSKVRSPYERRSTHLAGRR
jgi:hypothetical protein